jgi:hypothetical protein
MNDPIGGCADGTDPVRATTNRGLHEWLNTTSERNVHNWGRGQRIRHSLGRGARGLAPWGAEPRGGQQLAAHPSNAEGVRVFLLISE